MITKTERTELRSIVRNQFKVLRGEVRQREAEMRASIKEEVAAQFADEDRQWEVLQHRCYEITADANRQINDVLYELGYVKKTGSERVWLQAPKMSRDHNKRMTLEQRANTRILAQVSAAFLDLDRREADMLRDLAVGALESEEAQAFLAGIPTVGELVPATRLAELQASIDGQDK